MWHCMQALGWIVTGGLGMMLIAAIGGLILYFSLARQSKLMLPLVAFAAGSLIGGALFHMIPSSLEYISSPITTFIWMTAGFLLFLAMEQFLHWHHCNHAESDGHKPQIYLILLGDGLHNFLGGLAVGSAFIVDVKVGAMAWLAAAAHELPQELGDFAVLIHGGWERKKALLVNILAGATFLIGGLVAYGISGQIEISYLVPFAAGNFLYIGASDLIPEVNKHHSLKQNAIHFSAFLVGLGLLLALRLMLHH